MWLLERQHTQILNLGFFSPPPGSFFTSVLESHSRGSDARPGCRRLLSLHDPPFTGKRCIRFWFVYVLTLNPGRESFLLFDDKLRDKNEGITWQGDCHGSLLCRNVLRSVSLDTLSSNRKISCREAVKTFWLLQDLEILDLCQRNAWEWWRRRDRSPTHKHAHISF